MATGGEVAGSREQRSDEVQVYKCSTCSKSGQTTQASHYCPECGVCYCKLCLCDHAVLGRSMIEQWGKTVGKAGSLPKEDEKLKCLRHPEYDLEVYCVDHDVVCCRLCQAKEHRSCLNMEKMIVAAEERSLNDDIQNISTHIDNLNTMAFFLSGESEIRKQFTESSHFKYVSQLLEMKQNFNAKVDQIKEEADRRKQYYVDKFNTDQLLCTFIKDKVPKLKKALESSQERATRFVKVKRTKEFVDETTEKMSDILGTKISGVFEELPLEGERKILDVLTNEAPFKMSGLRFRVRLKDDKGECEIVGICQVGNGNMVLADKANTRLKQLNRDYTVINHYELQEIPNDVCAVDETEIAVAMNNNTILIFNVGTEFEIVRLLEMQNGCLHVAYHDDKIYTTNWYNCGGYRNCTCKTNFHICDKSGKELKSFQTKRKCYREDDSQIAVSQNGQIIYIAHPHDCVYAYELDGNKVAKSSYTGVVGLCTDKSGYLYISDRVSKEVVKCSTTGSEKLKKITTVLSIADSSTTPRAVCYDKKLDRVIAGSEKGDYIDLA